jgi:hypothetical protein
MDCFASETVSDKVELRRRRYGLEAASANVAARPRGRCRRCPVLPPPSGWECSAMTSRFVEAPRSIYHKLGIFEAHFRDLGDRWIVVAIGDEVKAHHLGFVIGRDSKTVLP